MTVRPLEAVRLDYETARRDLRATPQQSFLVAAYSVAMRITPVTAALACVVAGLVVLSNSSHWPVAVVTIAIGAFAPLLLVMFATLPLAIVAGGQALFAGSREETIRFGTGVFVYILYGWRYAFLGRRKPWAQLTAEEKRRTNPKRYETYYGEGL